MEERPDVAKLYMTLYKILNGNDTYPLFIIIDYSQVPLYMGTFDDNTSFLLPLLKDIKATYDNDKSLINDSYNEIINFLRLKKKSLNTNLQVTKKAIKDGFLLSSQVFDPYYGGFESLPKYPSPHKLIFLLKFGITENMINPTEMVEKTLISIYKGGLYDHLAGGFLRYSTDEKWLIPFFEKTLSTNALLVISYLDIFQITKSPLYKRIIENTLKYVNEEMINDNYSFCLSENLGVSDKDEDFYTFDYSEIINLLGDEDGSYFNDYYGITKEGNFNNKNILNLIDNYNFNKINIDINRLKEEVCSFRKKRKSLLKDFRIITYVNSLMSIAYTKAYRILNNGDYLELAIKNNKFIKDNLIDNKNNILRSTTKDTFKNLGYLDDYAYFIWSLIDLYESTFDVNYLEDAINYTKDMINLFWDFDYNGFFFSSKYYDPLILNLKYIEDNELPSGNSVAAFVLIKLNHLTKDDYLSDFCKKQFKVFYSEVSESPVNYTFYLSALIQNLYHSTDIICVSQDNKIPNDLRLLISDRFIPNLNILLITPSNKEKVLSLAPYTKDYKILNNKTTYYLFKNNKLIECSNILNI